MLDTRNVLTIFLLATSGLALATGVRFGVLADEPTPVAPSQNGRKAIENDATGDDQPREFRVTVVNSKGQPVEGATLIPTLVLIEEEADGRSSFLLDRKRVAPTKTDANGAGIIIFSRVPTDIPVITEPPFGPLWLTLKRVTPMQISLTIEHPDHPTWTGRARFEREEKIVLADAVTVQVRAIRSSDLAYVRQNLYPDLSGVLYGGDWSNDNGLLTIRRVNLTGPRPSRWLRLVHVPDAGEALFSEQIDLTQVQGNPISLRLSLKSGIRVEGQLAADVPRPIRNGRVVASLFAPRGDSQVIWGWGAAAEVAADGTFVLKSLPTAKHLQLVALCDGWISPSPTVAEIDAYTAAHHFPERKYAGPVAGRVYPRLLHLDGEMTQVLIPMEPTSSCKVLVLDPAGQPLPDATVRFRPVQYWFDANYAIVGHGIDDVAAVRILLASPDRQLQIEKLAEVRRDPFYQFKTDASGMAFVHNLPAGRAGEVKTATKFNFTVQHDDYASLGDRRQPQSVDVRPGETPEVTARMLAK